MVQKDKQETRRQHRVSIKRIMAIALSIIMIFTMVPFSNLADYNAYASTTTLQDKFVDEALKYQNLRYKQVREEMKKNGHSPLSFSGAYTDKTYGEWCAWYIMACSKNVGLTKIIPTKASGARVDHLCENIVNDGGGKLTFVNSTYKSNTSMVLKRSELNTNYKPKKGDIVLFGRTTGATHVGIVTNDASSWKDASTVEGNTGNDDRTKSIVAKRSTSIDRNGVVALAFVTPNYSNTTTSSSSSGSSSSGYNTYPDGSIVLVDPLGGPSNYVITSYVGNRIPPTAGASSNHAGLDMACSSGTLIHSATEGTVTLAGWVEGYGNLVKVQTGPYEIKYAHQSMILVDKGDKVYVGSQIGKVGSTGYSTGPHLHFEVRKNGQIIDPLPLLTTCTKHYPGKDKDGKYTGKCSKCGTLYTKWDTMQEKWDTSVKSQGKTYYSVTADNVKVRFYPDENSYWDRTDRPGVKVNKNDIVCVLAKKGSWYKIETRTGNVGYINQQYLKSNTANKSQSQLTSTISNKTVSKLKHKTSAVVKGSVQSNYPLKSIRIVATSTTGNKEKVLGKKSFTKNTWRSVTLNDSWQFVRDANLKNLSSGTWKIKIEAIDISGKKVTSSEKEIVVSDPEVKAPSISRVAVEEGYRVTITNNAGGGDMYVGVDGTPVKVSGASITKTISTSGRHQVKAYVWKDGKRSPNKVSNITVSTCAAPFINTEQYEGVIRVTIQATENLNDTIMYRTGGSGAYNVYDKSVLEVPDGTKIEAYSIRNGCIKSTITSIEAKLTEPNNPGLSLINSSQMVAAGDPVTVSWNKDNSASGYVATLLKGTEEVEKIETADNTATFVLEEAGEYIVSVTALNGVGSSDATTIKVTAVAPLTVVFKDAIDGDEEGQVFETLEVKYGDTPEAVPEPARRGYSFTGWKNTTTGITSVNAYMVTPVTENLVYEAAYSKETYRVKFYDQNGKLIDTQKVNYGESANLDYAESLVPVGNNEKFVGWSITNISENSIADLKRVDSDMNAQAVVQKKNPEIPLNIEIVSANRDSNTRNVSPEIKITSDDGKSHTIYLIVSLKSEIDGVDKTVYVDRQIYTVPAEEILSIGGNGDRYTFELNTANINIGSVTKMEAVALECNSDNTTGSALSNVEVFNTPVYPSTKVVEGLTERPEEADGRIIEEYTQYRALNTVITHSTADVVEGYENTGVTEYYNAANDTWSSTPVYTYSNWYSKKPSTVDVIDKGLYKEITEFDENSSLMHVNTYRSFTYYCDCKKTFSNKSKTVCSICGGKTTHSLVLYHEKPLTTLGSQNADGSYTGDKTVKKSIVGKVGVKYCMYDQGNYVDVFTSNGNHTYFWESTSYPGKTANVYRSRTYKAGTLFTKDIETGEWLNEKPSGKYVTRTAFRYIDPFEETPVGIEREFTGTIDTSTDLNGKLATIMIYQSSNLDPNKYQMQYTGQTTIGENNEVNFKFILQNEPTSETGNYIISLGVQGTTGLVKVGTVEIPEENRAEHSVKLFYTDSDNTVKYLGGTGEAGGELKVKDGANLDLSNVEVPTRDGYYFIGWSKNTFNITSDLEIEARYLPVQNAIVFVDWVNETIEIQKGLTGAKIKMPGAIEDSDGYKFKGWKLPDGSIIGAEEETDITGDMVISAAFEQDEYTVRFMDTTGSVISSQTVKHGEAAVPPAFTPSDGVFVSWGSDVKWWHVENDLDVYPVIVYNESAVKPVIREISDEDENKQVEIFFEDMDSEGTIYYTIDGVTPTNDLICEYINTEKEEYEGSIKEYTEPITLTEDTGIMAVGYSEGTTESEIAYQYYEVDPDNGLSSDFETQYETVTADETFNGWTALGSYDVKAKAGKDVNVNLSLDENPGLAGYDFLVLFDSSVFFADKDEYDKPIAEPGDVSKNGLFNVHDADGGYRFIWYGDEPTSDIGNLFNLTLHVDEDAEEGIYPISVYYAPENTVDEYDVVELKGVNINIESEASIDLSTLDVKIARDSYVYEGTAIEPVVIIDGLKEGEDYIVLYEDNQDVGTGKAIVTGIGDYSGTVEKPFTITQANIANAEVAEIPPEIATGSSIEPDLEIVYNDIELVKGIDFETVYSNNTEQGTATVTITGIGNFKGSTSIEFEIIETVESQLEQALRDKEAAEQALQEKEEELQAAEAAKEAAEQALSETQAQLEAAQAAKEAAEQRADEAEAALSTAQQQLTQAQADLEAAQAQVAELQAQLAASQGDNAELQAQLDAANEALNTAQQNLTEAINAKDALEAELAKAQADLAAAEAQVGSLQTQLSEANAALEEANNAMDALEAELEAANAALEEAEKALEELLQEASVIRYFGKSRFDTSLKAADAYKEQLGLDKFDNVIIACGTNYADALAGSYLSNVEKAPILLTDAREETIALIQGYIRENLNEGGTVYVLGGTGAVPDSVVSGLNGFTTKRLAGTDRFSTNIEILKEAGITGDELLVASGMGFADSLSASATGKPILLVGKKLNDSQKAYVESLDGMKFCLIGGSGAVNEDIEGYFKSLGDTERVFGQNRYETSVNVAKRFFKAPRKAVLAYGLNFPDGLCGGSLANAMGGPLILTSNGKDCEQATAYAKEMKIHRGAVLGGPGLISDESVMTVFGLIAAE